MTRIAQFLSRATREVCGALGTAVLWLLWLALGFTLVVQLYVASTNELAVPEFVLRRLEKNLADAGLRATASRTSFDPTGRVLVANLRLYLPQFSEPIISARSVYLELNPWSALLGRFES